MEEWGNEGVVEWGSGGVGELGSDLVTLLWRRVTLVHNNLDFWHAC